MGDLLQTQRYVINASNCLDLLASLIKVHKMSKTKVPTIDQKCNFRGTAVDYTGMYLYKTCGVVDLRSSDALRRKTEYVM